MAKFSAALNILNWPDIFCLTLTHIANQKLQCGLNTPQRKSQNIYNILVLVRKMKFKFQYSSHKMNLFQDNF